MGVHKDSQHGTWYCKIKYRDWTGKKRETTRRGFRTKRDAQNFEHDFKESATERPNICVKTLCLDYLAARRPQIRETTYIAKKYVFSHYIVPYFGALPVDKLTPLKIVKWQNELLKTITYHKKPFSPVTVRTMTNIFSAALNWGVRFYHLKYNPVSRVEPVKVEKQEMQIWEESDLQKALTFECTQKKRCILLLLFYSGMRVGEMRALTMEDFDFETNCITITKSMNQSGKITPPKNNSSLRVISMPDSIMQEFKTYFQRLSFDDPHPFRIATTALGDHLHRLARRAGLPQIRVHDLRHSHASYLIQHNVPITAVSRRLGHRSPAITLTTYSHMYRENDADIADMIDKSIKTGVKRGSR